MQIQGLPWSLLLATLKRGDRSPVAVSDVVRAGADPEVLVRRQLLELGRAASFEARACGHGGPPTLDFEGRQHEGLVGVACPAEPACWPGWNWLPREEVDSLHVRAPPVLAALAARNGLTPISTAVPAPFAAVGMLRRRGLSIPVVWLRSAVAGFESLCRGLRAQLNHDGLIVLVAQDPRVPFCAAARIAVIELLDDASGDLQLERALNELTPDYWSDVVSDPTLDLDYVRLRFATSPGRRHVVQINGQDFGGFRKSDLKFLRLLLLAAARKNGKDDGWLDKSRLRDGSDKDPALNDLRAELGKYDLCGLAEEERRALVRVQRGTGLIRLGVPPENITLDASLAELTFVAATTTVRKDGTKTKPTKKQEEGLQNAATLLRDCRRLGAPGGVEVARTSTATSRRDRSAA